MPNDFESSENLICEQEKIVQRETRKLFELHQNRPSTTVQNYTFQTANGPLKLSDLFGDKSELVLIHNMGRQCSYCTLWADGINGFADHFENRAALALISNDSVQDQKTFAESRGWRFQIASAKDTTFSKDMGFYSEKSKLTEPGTSIFVKNSDGSIFHKTRAGFGPGDLFASIWNFFELLPGGVGDWAPKFSYPTKNPEKFRLSPNIAINVRNIDNAVSFYRDTLGFSISKPPSDPTHGIPMQKGKTTFWLDPVDRDESAKAGQVFFEFIVTELDASIHALKAKGCELLQVTSCEEFKGQMMSDPFGMKFHLYQPVAKVPTAEKI